MKTLYIYDCPNDREWNQDGEIHFYGLNQGALTGPTVKTVGTVEEFNRIARDERDSYCDFIYSLDQAFRETGLIYSGASLYSLSDVACKRTEIYETYPAYCHAVLIRRSLEKYGFERLVLDGVTADFVSLIRKSFPETKIEVASVRRSGGLWRPTYFSQPAFFLGAFWKIAYAKLFWRRMRAAIGKRLVRRVFLTRSPIHLKLDLTEDKYGALVTANDVYLVNVLTDGFHQSLGFKRFRETVRGLRKHGDRIVLIDSMISLLDGFRWFFRSYSWILKSRRMDRRRFVHAGIDLAPYLEKELRISLLRISRMYLYRNAVENLSRRMEIGNLIYYLHEYPYGRAFARFFREFSPKTRLIGFQHGPAAQRKMLYFMASGEAASFPIPDEVWAEDPDSQEIYRFAGYPEVRLMDEIYRLAYLRQVRRESIEEGSVLVACGLHDGYFLFTKLESEIVDNPGRKYYFKLHPRGASDRVLGAIRSAKLRNLVVERGDLVSLLSKVSEVVVTYSSVGYEAKLLGIPVRIIQLPGRIDESPLSG